MRERCDHCKKWIVNCQAYTLEGIVSEGVDFNFAVCESCSLKPYTSEYWNKWVKKLQVKS